MPAPASFRAFQYFVRTGSLSGILLLGATALALICANSPLADGYFGFLARRIVIGWSDHPLDLALLGWINDGLMAVFFLLVGLEIKRELMVGELASIRQAALPIAAAAGGMVVPAVLYWSVNPGGPAAAGWGIPMATDIAFALGILTLLGDRIPLGLKVFLTALAIVDDMGAVVVIALFYSGALHPMPLAVGAAAVLGLVVMNRLGIRRITPYLFGGAVLWLSLHDGGIHATVAGVLVAMTIPTRTRTNTAEFSERARELVAEFDRTETGDGLVITSKGQQEALHELEREAERVQAPLLRLEHGMQPLVQYGIMPLFAFANAGVQLGGTGNTPLLTSASLGIVLGLVIGKPVGILLCSWAAVRFGLSGLPTGVSWRSLGGVACLGGIGFTMSLFIAALAFDPDLLTPAKTGILIGSALSASLGIAILVRERRADRSLPVSAGG